MSFAARLTNLQSALAVRAPALIVTVYGDIAVPRGGALWMGTLIDVCATLGVSETLARTAVSRLVAAGKLYTAFSPSSTVTLVWAPQE